MKCTGITCYKYSKVILKYAKDFKTSSKLFTGSYSILLITTFFPTYFYTQLTSLATQFLFISHLFGTMISFFQKGLLSTALVIIEKARCNYHVYQYS